jgi:hypothetical protein
VTPADLAARVAALLDAGCPGHVRDLYEDLAADLGEAEGRSLVHEALMDCRFIYIGRGQVGCPAHGWAKALYDEMRPGPHGPARNQGDEMSQHTPGPWDGSERNAVTAAKGEIGIAILEPLKHFWGNAAVVDDFRTMKANAALIAAAPDLLRACEAILAGWGHQGGVSRAVELARAAVARARGD